MDWDNLERQVRALLPEQPLKENRCWIGILSHKWSVPDKLRESDIGWFVGNRVSERHESKKEYECTTRVRTKLLFVTLTNAVLDEHKSENIGKVSKASWPSGHPALLQECTCRQ